MVNLVQGQQGSSSKSLSPWPGVMMVGKGKSGSTREGYGCPVGVAQYHSLGGCR